VFQRNRASAGFDQRHVFQLGWVYELPFGPGKKFLNSGNLASKIVGGWQFSGIESCYTGLPFTVTAPKGNLNDNGSNTQTANQLMKNVPFLCNVGPGQHYYDPAAFAPVTAALTFGNSGRNTLVGPGIWNTDMSISRVFPIRESLKLEFRTEFYNLPNTSHFGGPAGGAGAGPSGANPDGGVTDSNFMQITQSWGERQIRFGARLSW